MALPQSLIDTANKQGLQYNLMLPGGDILPANINPGQAATLDFSGGLMLPGNANPFAGTPLYDALASHISSQGLNPQGEAQMHDLSTSVGKSVAGNYAVNPPAATPGTANPNADFFNKPGFVGANPVTLPGVSPAGGSQPPIPPINPANPATTPAGGNPPGTPATVQPPPGSATTPVDPTSYLTNNVQINALKSKIDDLRQNIEAGISTQNKTKILTDLMDKYGVSENVNIANSLNQEILKSQQELRDLPLATRDRLKDVGISESQVKALIEQNSIKPRDTLARLLEQKGAVESTITNSMKFVEMFANTEYEDQAAKLKANQFELENLQGDYKNLTENQRLLFEKAFTMKEDIMKVQASVAEKGIATPQEMAAINKAGSYEEALSLAQPVFERAKADTDYKAALSEIHTAVINSKFMDTGAVGALVKQITDEYNMSHPNYKIHTDQVIQGLKDGGGLGDLLTKGQKVTGANNAGVDTNAFGKFDQQTQSYFAKVSAKDKGIIEGGLNAVTQGKVTPEDAKKSIDSKDIPQGAKDVYMKKIDELAAKNKKSDSGNPWSNFWQSVKGLVKIPTGNKPNTPAPAKPVMPTINAPSLKDLNPFK